MVAAGVGRQFSSRWRPTVARALCVGIVTLAVSGIAGPVSLASSAFAGTATCTPSLLVLSAMPLELDPLLASAQVSSAPAVVLHDRPFVTGILQGNHVIMGLTGIGPANALAATTDAFDHFQCNGQSEITGVVFSGTSGGDFIGDVFVPTAWSDDGAAPVPTDATMYAAAQQAMAQDPPALEQSTPVGDPFCTCDVVPTVDNLSTPVAVQHAPTVEFGGTGLTTDPFNGMALPCAPAGSDVFGCVPCREIGTAPLQQTEDFATGTVPFLEPTWLAAYLQASTPPGSWVSSDNETAVVAAAAQAHGVPFIGFRAASDGGGDPLHLPGFPAEFFVYRQLAADNAAAATLSFLQLWGATH